MPAWTGSEPLWLTMLLIGGLFVFAALILLAYRLAFTRRRRPPLGPETRGQADPPPIREHPDSVRPGAGPRRPS